MYGIKSPWDTPGLRRYYYETAWPSKYNEIINLDPRYAYAENRERLYTCLVNNFIEWMDRQGILSPTDATIRSNWNNGTYIVQAAAAYGGLIIGGELVGLGAAEISLFKELAAEFGYKTGILAFINGKMPLLKYIKQIRDEALILGSEIEMALVNQLAKEGATEAEVAAAEEEVGDVLQVIKKEGYTYNMVENPGPLADLDHGAAGTFAAGKYNAITLQEDTILYRAGKAGGGQNGLGQYFTRTAPESSAISRIDYAIKPQWVDRETGALTGTSPLESVYAVKIPAGTTIYEGPAGFQAGVFLGGKD